MDSAAVEIGRMSSRDSDRISSAQQTLDSQSTGIGACLGRTCFANGIFFSRPCSLTTLVLYDISQLLNTQLDKETLATCVSMIESGVNPEALAVRSTSLRTRNEYRQPFRLSYRS